MRSGWTASRNNLRLNTGSDYAVINTDSINSITATRETVRTVTHDCTGSAAQFRREKDGRFVQDPMVDGFVIIVVDGVIVGIGFCHSLQVLRGRYLLVLGMDLLLIMRIELQSLLELHGLLLF